MLLFLKTSYFHLCAFVFLSCMQTYGEWNYTIKPDESRHDKDFEVDAVNQIIKNYLTVSGHRQIFEENRALKMSGRNKTAFDKLIGVDICEYEVLFVQPNKGYLKLSFYNRGATRTFYEIYDGKFVWSLAKMISPPKIEKYGVGDRALIDIKILPSLLFFDPNVQPEWVIYKGKEAIGDRELYQIEFGYTNLENIQLFFDSKTFLLTEIRSRALWMEGIPAVDWKYRILRYRKYDGLYLPVNYQLYAGSSIMESIEFTDCQFVDEWDEDIFNTRSLEDKIKHGSI